MSAASAAAVREELENDEPMRAEAYLLAEGERGGDRLYDWARDLARSGQVADREAFMTTTRSEWRAIARELRS